MDIGKVYMKYLTSVVTLKLDTDLCIGCGMCVEVCPHEVFAIENRKANLLDRDSCMECGACQMNCPTGAVTVRSGVGCAAGIISSKLGVKGACACSCGEDCE
jgi:NAD-dependent dihydropyrimidine dehydrogenase PreA subunit